MNRARLIASFSIALGIVVAGPGDASAGGSALAEQGVTAAGVGGAATARDDDAGAAWYNPAALADGGGLRLGLGLLAAMPSIHAEGISGDAGGDVWEADTESGAKTPFHLNAAYSRGDWAGGLSVGVPHGGGATWPEDWRGRHEVVSSDLMVIRVAPFVGYRFGKLRVAAGVHVDLASLEIVRGLDFVDTEGTVDLTFTGHAIGGDLAVFYDVNDYLSLGASYKSRGAIAFEGPADFDAPLEFSQKTRDQMASAEMTLPDRIAVGARWRPADSLALYGDLELTTWSVREQLVIDFTEEMTPDAVQDSNWSTTVAIRGGAEHVWGRNVFRAGAFFDPSPAPADTLSPTAPDSTRLGASAGYTRDLGKGVAVDAFYEYLRLRPRTASGGDPMEARYSGRIHLLGLGLRYTLED